MELQESKEHIKMVTKIDPGDVKTWTQKCETVASEEEKRKAINSPKIGLAMEPGIEVFQ